MEINEIPMIETPNVPLEVKEYELKLGADTYLLKMENHSNDLITFNVIQINKLSNYHYFKEYNYDKLLNLLFLNKSFYNNISKIYQFCDIAISKNKINLIKDNEKIILSLKNIVNFEEIECKLDLFEKKISNEEMINKIINLINEIKLKGINVNENLPNKKYEELQSKINIITEEYRNDKKELESKINLLNEKIILLIEENKKVKKEFESKIDLLTEENRKLKNIIEKYKDNLNPKDKQIKKDKEDNIIK